MSKPYGSIRFVGPKVAGELIRLRLLKHGGGFRSTKSKQIFQDSFIESSGRIMANPDLLAFEETPFWKIMSTWTLTSSQAMLQTANHEKVSQDGSRPTSNHGKLPASHNHLAHHLFNGWSRFGAEVHHCHKLDKDFGTCTGDHKTSSVEFC